MSVAGSPITPNAFEHLCRAARQRGFHVELCAGKTLYGTGAVRFRRIEQLRVTLDADTIVCAEPMANIGDRSKAAAVLLKRLQAKP